MSVRSSAWGGWSAARAGTVLIVPMIDRMVKVDLRVITMDVPSQEAIMRDNVTVRVNACCSSGWSIRARYRPGGGFGQATWNIADHPAQRAGTV
jgi:regulator of protease activity HflC (stomatin/prohibitin superfamily)